MDKLQAWLRRIQQPPRREVANLDYWALLAETRIAEGTGLPPERAPEDRRWDHSDNPPQRTAG